MDLVSEFEAPRGASLLTEHTERFGSDEVVVLEPFDEQPQLAVDTTLRQASRGRGQVVFVACSSDVVCVATSRGFLLRYHWDDYGNEKVSEVEVVKGGPDTQLTGLWVDPLASHMVLAAKVHGVPEVHYLHRRWPRARALTKLRGTALTALAWPQEGSAQHSDSCTGPMLLGTELGMLHELVVEEATAAKKEPGPLRQLLDLRDRRRAVCGLHQEATREGGLLVLIATPLALYALRGTPGSGGSLEALFAAHQQVPLAPALEVSAPPTLAFGNQGGGSGGQQPAAPSRLHLYRPQDTYIEPVRFGWLVGHVVYHGHLAGTGPATQGSSPQQDVAGVRRGSLTTQDGALLQDVRALPLLDPLDVPSSPSPSLLEMAAGHSLPPPASSPVPSMQAGKHEEELRGLIMTEWHFMVATGDRLRAMNRVSGRCTAQRVLGSPLISKDVSGEMSRAIDGLCQDPVSRAIYMYSDESLYEVNLRKESSGMWHVFMDLQDWSAALAWAHTPVQRDCVHCAQAEAAAAAHDYGTAADHWARVVGGQPTFEDISLRLIELEVPDALMTFLFTRLSCLGRADRAQSTMVAAWLTELQLDTLNKLLLQSGGTPSVEYQAAETRLRTFLTDQVDHLDPGTTVGLLAGAGRMDELLAFAQARHDHQAVLEALLQRPDGAIRALAVLRKPSCSPELAYRFAPGLLAAAPAATVDFLVSVRPTLEPRRLMPALLRFSEPGSSPLGRREVLRYVEYALSALGTQDSAVHNLAAALHSLADTEDGLLSYLARARGPTGQPLYDPKYVLRLAGERGKRKAEVKLLCELGMYEDAVRRALAVDVGAAKAVASAPPEEEEGLRRRLWLAVARHVVQQGTPQSGDQVTAIKQAVELLKEAGGLIKIEDILPFFPDFVTIDNFKEAICDSLERYNNQIEELKSEMEEATEIAEAVRADLKVLGTRAAVVRPSVPCARCGRALLDPPPAAAIEGLPAGGALPPFYVFPTGLAYHAACCAAEAFDLHPAGGVARGRITGIMGRLARLKPGDSAAQALLTQLAEEVACEDPRNGELLVRLVDTPYVDLLSDKGELDSWAVAA